MGASSKGLGTKLGIERKSDSVIGSGQERWMERKRKRAGERMGEPEPRTERGGRERERVREERENREIEGQKEREPGRDREPERESGGRRVGESKSERARERLDRLG